jgi:hypothetical protein
MQNQTDSARSAKPQEPRLPRRVAASFNHSIEPTEASRYWFAVQPHSDSMVSVLKRLAAEEQSRTKD